MILHLLEDDKNIINRTVEQYEKLCPGYSDYWIDDSSIHEISFTDNSLLVKRVNFSTLTQRVNISKYRAIIFHALSPQKQVFLNNLVKPTHLKLIWIEWGMDMYGIINLKGYKLINYIPSLFKLRDRKMFFGSWKAITPLWLKKIVKNSDTSIFEHAILKLDYIGISEEELSLLKFYFPKVSAELVSYNYYPIEMTIGNKLIDKRICGNNILLGNSSAKENNHYRAFQILKNIPAYSKVIVPLSYGNMSYRKFAIEKGKALLGNRFIPLVDFLPIEDYYNVLLSCGIVIMPHLRQQAVGNIIVPLYLGAKVFLYEENPLYSFFLRLGIKIFSLNKLSVGHENLEMLDATDAENNKFIISAHFSTAATENYIKELLRKIN
jgi:hypothetical protein